MQCAKPFTLCQENPLLMAFLLYHQLRIDELLNIHHDGDTKEGHTRCTQKMKPIILCGDLNVAAEDIDLKNPQANHKNPGFTDQERDKFRQLKASGFTDSFRFLHPDEIAYSWWSYRFNARARDAGWRIDYFMVDDTIKDRIKDARIHSDIFGSDHCPVSLEIDIQ